MSIIILVITAPLWVIPVYYLKTKWVEYEKLRLQRVKIVPLEQAMKINWIVRGTFFFGGTMWLLMSLVPFLFKHNSSVHNLFIQLPVWLLAGLLWGLWMGRWTKKREAPSSG